MRELSEHRLYQSIGPYRWDLRWILCNYEYFRDEVCCLSSILSTATLVAQMPRIAGVRDAFGLEFLLGEGSSWPGGRAQQSVLLEITTCDPGCAHVCWLVLLCRDRLPLSLLGRYCLGSCYSESSGLCL